jgi:hypothetical protein
VLFPTIFKLASFGFLFPGRRNADGTDVCLCSKHVLLFRQIALKEPECRQFIFKFSTQNNWKGIPRSQHSDTEKGADARALTFLHKSQTALASTHLPIQWEFDLHSPS